LLCEDWYAEVVIRPGEDLKFEAFDDADWDAYSLAASRKCKEKRPAFIGIPPSIGITALKHLLAVIAVESGLAVMHIVGLTPEAKTLEMAFAGHKPMGEFVIGKQELQEAYQLANTAKGRNIDFVLLGCPHVTLREFRDLSEILHGKKVHDHVKLIVSTTRLLMSEAEDLGYVDAIRNAGGIVTTDMCIAFAGSNVKGTIATNSIEAVFFYTGFCSSAPNEVRFGSIRDCARSALTGKWEGRIRQ
jgi:predicted aconitase